MCQTKKSILKWDAVAYTTLQDTQIIVPVDAVGLILLIVYKSSNRVKNTISILPLSWHHGYYYTWNKVII